MRVGAAIVAIERFGVVEGVVDELHHNAANRGVRLGGEKNGEDLVDA